RPAPPSRAAPSSLTPTAGTSRFPQPPSTGPLRGRTLRVSLPQLLDLRPATRVQHLLLRQPRAPRLRDAHLDVLQRTELARVGIHGDLDAGLAGHARVAVAQGEAGRLRVDLEERAGLERLLDDPFELHVRGRADVDLARGQVADHVDLRVVHRRQNALRRVAVERRVQ